MNIDQNQESAETEKLKEIPKWTRKYAQNRTLTTLVLMVMICFISMGIVVLTTLVWAAFVKGNMILAGVSIALLVAVLILLIIFVSKYGGKNRGLIDQQIDQQIYGCEGITSMPEPKLTKKKKWLDIVVGAVIFIGGFGSWYLSMKGYIAPKYLQPISAIYFVPHLVFEYFQQRPRFGPLVLLWPILYTIHAILIVAGVPIFFTGNLCVLSICLPLLVYSFLAYVIGHLYIRYALKKLKGITRLEGDAANGD